MILAIDIRQYLSLSLHICIYIYTYKYPKPPPMDLTWSHLESLGPATRFGLISTWQPHHTHARTTLNDFLVIYIYIYINILYAFLKLPLYVCFCEKMRWSVSCWEVNVETIFRLSRSSYNSHRTKCGLSLIVTSDAVWLAQAGTKIARQKTRWPVSCREVLFETVFRLSRSNYNLLGQTSVWA